MSVSVKTSCLWILLACLVAYANIYGNGFLWDDLDFIVKNYELRSLVPVTKFLFSASAIPQRPIMALSLALDYRLWGLNPAGYHLTQILLHSANALLVFILLSQFFGSRLTGFLAGFLFALHPVHAEAVTAFLGRSELTMAFFTLLALGAFLVHLKYSGIKGWVGYGGSLLAYALACLSKETGIVLPLLLLLVIGLSPFQGAKRRPWKGLLLRLLPFGVVALLYLLYRRSVAWEIVRPWWGGSPYRSGLMMLTVILDYARLLVFPLHLSPWYITRVPGSIWEWKVIFGAFLFVASLALTFVLRARAWLLSLGLGWILISLLPVSNLIPIPGSMMAERWLYLPSVGFCWVAGWLLSEGFGRLREKRFARMLAGLCFGVLAGLALVRVWTWNAVWHDGERLFRTMLSRNDANTLAHSRLGDFYLDQSRLQEAAREYSATLFYQPLASRGYEGLGSVSGARGLKMEALACFQKAVALDPDFTQAHYGLGMAFAEQGDTTGAIGELQWVVNKEPLNPVPNESLGTLLLSSGRAEESLRFFQQALAVRPRDPALHFQAGQAYRAIKNWDLAKAEFSQTLSLDPDFQKAREALILLDQHPGGTR